MDSSENEVRKEIKAESIELFEVPIENGTKSVNEVKLNDVPIQNGIESEIEGDYNPNIEAKKEVPVPKCDLNEDKVMEKSNSAYCALCQVRLWYQPIDIVLQKHLNGKKHLGKLKDQEKSTMPKMNFIITDPAQMPYYCVCVKFHAVV